MRPCVPNGGRGFDQRRQGRPLRQGGRVAKWANPGRSMEEALAEFLRHLALEKNASAHTVKSYREDLVQALEFFRARSGGSTPPVSQLTTRFLRAYLAWLH